MKKTTIVIGALAGLAFAASSVGALSVAKTSLKEVDATPKAASTDFYLRGSWNGWSDADPFDYLGTDEGKKYYSIKRTFTAGEEFKVYQSGVDYWGVDMYGTAQKKSAFDGGGSSNFRVVTSGTYTLYFCDNAKIYEVTDETTTTLYFANGYSWSNVYAHCWNTNGILDTWPGEDHSATRINSLALKCKVGDTFYDGIGIWRVDVPSAATKVIFTNNSQQTGTLDVSKGEIYSYEVNEKYFPVVQLLLDINSGLGSYTYDEVVYEKSICAISDKASIVSRFEALAEDKDSDVVTSVNGSSIVTYDVENGGTKNQTLSDICLALKSKVSTAAFVSPIADRLENTGVALATALGAAGAVAGTAFILISKKRRI